MPAAAGRRGPVHGRQGLPERLPIRQRGLGGGAPAPAARWSEHSSGARNGSTQRRLHVRAQSGAALHSNTDCVVDSITVSNASAAIHGGGVYCAGISSLTNSALALTNAQQHGGAVYFGASSVLSNVTVVNTWAVQARGGALASEVPALYFHSATALRPRRRGVRAARWCVLARRLQHRPHQHQRHQLFIAHGTPRRRTRKPHALASPLTSRMRARLVAAACGRPRTTCSSTTAASR